MHGDDHEGEKVFIEMSSVDPCFFADLAFTWLQGANIFDDLVDLRIVERPAEGRHGAFLAVLDADAKKVVVSLGDP